MLPLGLSAGRQREFHRALTGTRIVRPFAQVLTLDHKVVADVSHMIVDGAVNFSNDAETTRSCSLDLWDPSGHIGFGDNDPSDGALFLDNMIRAGHTYDWPGNQGDPIDVPLFTGPVHELNRDAWTIAIGALGKESIALRRAWHPVTYSVGYVTDIIRWLLRRAGETKFDIPDLKYVTTSATVIWPMSQLWKHAQKLATSIDRQLFYDGRGVVRLRKIPAKPVWIFEDGPNGILTARPRVTYDVARVRNRVWVRGRKPKGKERVNGDASLPRTNPFSAWRLGRGPDHLGGELVEPVENDRMKTNRECHEHAVTILNRINRQQVSIEYDPLPVPHLEEGDVVEVDSDDIRWTHHARNFSIPLTGGPMSMSTTRRMVKGRKVRVNPLEPEVWGDPHPLLGATWDTGWQQ